MSTTTAHTDAWVCTDCYFAYHYGAHEHDGQRFAGDSDTPADREPLARLTGELSDNTCSNHYYGQDSLDSVEDENGDLGYAPCDHCGQSGYEDGMEDFSWRTCEGCGSTLGGSRHRLAVWES